MKKNHIGIAIAMLLAQGCAGGELKNEDCVEWQHYEIPVSECTGGRGVAPQFCVTRSQTKYFCVSYIENKI